MAADVRPYETIGGQVEVLYLPGKKPRIGLWRVLARMPIRVAESLHRCGFALSVLPEIDSGIYPELPGTVPG